MSNQANFQPNGRTTELPYKKLPILADVACVFFGYQQDKLGVIHKHLLGEGAWCKKGGPLKFLTLVRGDLEKITLYFPVKLEFSFHGKKGALQFFEVWRGRGPWKFFVIKTFCIRPPYRCLWTVPYLSDRKVTSLAQVTEHCLTRCTLSFICCLGIVLSLQEINPRRDCLLLCLVLLLKIYHSLVW